MILARVPITALSRFMGHTSIAVTVDRYWHLYPSERQPAVGAFDALMSGGLADTARIALTEPNRHGLQNRRSRVQVLPPLSTKTPGNPPSEAEITSASKADVVRDFGCEPIA
jgi:hypothetical protein